MTGNGWTPEQAMEGFSARPAPADPADATTVAPPPRRPVAHRPSLEVVPPIKEEPAPASAAPAAAPEEEGVRPPEPPRPARASVPRRRAAAAREDDRRFGYQRGNRVEFAVFMPDDLSDWLTAQAKTSTLGDTAIAYVREHFEQVLAPYRPKDTATGRFPAPRPALPRYEEEGGSRRRMIKVSVEERDALDEVVREIPGLRPSTLVRMCVEAARAASTVA